MNGQTMTFQDVWQSMIAKLPCSVAKRFSTPYEGAKRGFNPLRVQAEPCGRVGIVATEQSYLKCWQLY
jgi:hypothetical protein